MGTRIGIALGALAAVGAVVGALVASGGTNSHRPSSKTTAQPPSVLLGQAVPATPGELAARINLSQTIIDDRSTPGAELARGAVFEQLATLVLEHETATARGATFAALGKQADATMRADLDAGVALSRLGRPQAGLPHWRIVQPPPPNTLRGYFEAAQAQFRVPWEDLAAIELIETDFGRVEGSSPAGARGPMQFMPATWALYGSGGIDDARDAILAAARFLDAHGAPGDMTQALYDYNNSGDYVRAVEDYASRMRSDARAYYGYYDWQVLYEQPGATVILPVGYPKARPQPVTVPSQG